jgi:hypothetical protein
MRKKKKESGPLSTMPRVRAAHPHRAATGGGQELPVFLAVSGWPARGFSPTQAKPKPFCGPPPFTQLNPSTLPEPSESFPRTLLPRLQILPALVAQPQSPVPIQPQPAHSRKPRSSRVPPPSGLPRTSVSGGALSTPDPSHVDAVHLARLRLRALHLPCYRGGSGGGGHVLFPRPFPPPDHAVPGLADGDPRACDGLQLGLPHATNPAGNNFPFVLFVHHVVR